MVAEEMDTKTHLYNLLVLLESELRTKQKVADIFEVVSSHTQPGGESEGNFIKYVLRQPLETIFHGQSLTIEGIESKGITQFKKFFFSIKPALDFIVRDLELVGEVKYTKLDLQKLALAIGQATMYVGASSAESYRLSYGIVIFCDIGSTEMITLTEVEESFKKDLWEKNGIFLILI